MNGNERSVSGNASIAYGNSLSNRITTLEQEKEQLNLTINNLTQQVQSQQETITSLTQQINDILSRLISANI